MKNIFAGFTAPVSVIKMIMKYTPGYFIFFVPQVLLSSVLPIIYVYAPKLIIEGLTNESTYSEIVIIIGVFSGVVLLINLLISFLSKKNNLCVEKFSGMLRAEIGQHVMNLELSDIESAGTRDNVRLAGNAAGIIGFTEVIKNLIQNIITLIGFVAIIAGLDITFFSIVGVLLVVKIVFTYISHIANNKMRILSAKNNRTGDYLTNVCYFNQGGAKEIRVNSIQSWFLDKVKDFRLKMVKLQYKDFRRNMLFDSINDILFAGSSFYILWSLSSYYLDNVISIADFTLYFTTVTAMTATLGAITDLVSQYHRHLINAADFKKLKSLSERSNVSITNNPPLRENPKNIEIVFSDVWFAYPNSENYVLRGINIKISPREKLVIVGYNGAGKSTFIKLLCKFYRPTKGIITLNGIDIWDISNEQYHSVIAAVFQDFVTFAFTICENISMKDGYANVSEVLMKSGLHDFVSSLPNGEETCISKKISSNGIELSGGQGQKIAIARALYKDTPVLILDEPTASLDVKAESEIYSDFMRIATDKTTIFISHRLAASQIADHIAVFSDGEIVEYGSHKALMALNGVYADMYEKQSRPYIEEITIF